MYESSQDIHLFLSKIRDSHPCFPPMNLTLGSPAILLHTFHYITCTYEDVIHYGLLPLTRLVDKP